MLQSINFKNILIVKIKSEKFHTMANKGFFHKSVWILIVYSGLVGEATDVKFGGNNN